MSHAWENLREQTPARLAYLAQGRFLASPEEAVALGQHLSPAADVYAKHLARLLADLDSDEAPPPANRRPKPWASTEDWSRRSLRETLARTTSEEVRRRVNILWAQIAPATTTPSRVTAWHGAWRQLNWPDTPEVGVVGETRRRHVMPC